MDKKVSPIAQPMPQPVEEMPMEEMPVEETPAPVPQPNMMPTPMCNMCMYGQTNTCPLMMGAMPNMNQPMPMPTPAPMPSMVQPIASPNPNTNVSPMMQQPVPNNMVNPMMQPMQNLQPAKEPKKSREFYDYDEIDDIDDFVEDEYMEGARVPYNDGRNVDRCVRRIERELPGIINRMTRCGIPRFQALNMIRRIVIFVQNNCCR